MDRKKDKQKQESVKWAFIFWFPLFVIHMAVWRLGLYPSWMDLDLSKVLRQLFP